MHFTYKFRLYPNRKTKELLNQWFGQIRFVYNYFLGKSFKENAIEYPGYYKCASMLIDLKRTEEYSWLKQCPSQSLQTSLKHLDEAFKRFFNKLGGKPRFKKRNYHDSIHFPQGFKFSKDFRKLRIPKCPYGIKMKVHRSIQGQIRSITITRNNLNEYFISILVDREIESLPKTDKSVGIDLGMVDYCVDSTGSKTKIPYWFKHSD